MASVACPLMFIVDLLSQSATFWGVLAGSFFSLGGVWITNLTAARNLRRQHDHDRAMRNRDREMTLRKDIYLGAVEAIAAGYYCVAKFADFKSEGDALTATFIEKAPALAKVNIVAGPSVLRAITTAEAELNAAFMRLWKARVAGTVAKRDHVLLSRRLESNISMQTRAVEMLNEENLKGRPDAIRCQGIQANFDFASAEIDRDLPVQRQLESKIQSEQLRVSGLVTLEMVHLIESFVPAVFTVRSELDLPIDEAELRLIFLNVAERTRDGMTGFIEEMGAEVANQDSR